MESGLINFALIFEYVLVGIALVCVIVLPLIKAIDDPKTLIGTAIGLGVVFAIFGIAYAVSSDAVPPRYITFDVGPGISKFVGGLLTTMYFLLGAAVVAIVYTEVSKAFK